MGSKNKICVIGGLIYVDRYFLSAAFQKSILRSAFTNLEVTYFTKVTQSINDFDKFKFNNSNFHVKFISLSFYFRFHRLTNYVRKLNYYLHDYSLTDFKSRIYFYEKMDYNSKFTSKLIFKFAKKYNNRLLRLCVQ